VTPRSIGFLYYPGWMCRPGMRKVGQGILEETVLAPVTIEQNTPTPIGFLCCPGWMCGPRN